MPGTVYNVRYTLNIYHLFMLKQALRDGACFENEEGGEGEKIITKGRRRKNTEFLLEKSVTYSHSIFKSDES